MGMWRDGILGVVTGDALGCPVEFSSRIARDNDPVTGMRGYGTFSLPAGSWTDDSSLTLATLDSLCDNRKADLNDIMHRFIFWLYRGKYTPFGSAFDVGRGTLRAVRAFKKNENISTCGGDGEGDNGNGSLMRIMPACLYCYSKIKGGEMTDKDAVTLIHQVSALTHRHIRSEMACGLYFFMVMAILNEESSLIDKLQSGLDAGFEFYKNELDTTVELSYFARLRNLYEFQNVPRTEIRSSGYVIDTIEAAVWCLITTRALPQALLKAVNLGDDTDTVAAIAGGLAGLFYGAEDIPKDWLEVLKRREWIEGMCGRAEELFK